MDALILAGGENRRFSAHKALVDVGGQSIIRKTISLFQTIFRSVWISTNNPEVFFVFRLPMIGDLLPVRGPMTGIYSGLVATGSPELFVAAGDMPFISEDLVRLVMKHYSHGDDAIIPMFRGEAQPLLGIYAAHAVTEMRSSLTTGRRSMKGLLERMRTASIPEHEVTRVDSEGLSFVNINTMEEYRAAQDFCRKGRGHAFGIQ